jgi:Tfp pilus assembly protein PilF
MKPMTLFLNAGLGILVLLLSAGCAGTKDKEREPVVQESRETTKPATPAVAPAPPRVDKAQQELQAGIASYENGSYRVAARQLQSALALGLETPSAEARAHKYLAFMHCVGGRQSSCRDEFRKALNADPAFDLTPAEAGHPTWGPVFRKVKAAARSARK